MIEFENIEGQGWVIHRPNAYGYRSYLVHRKHIDAEAWWTMSPGGKRFATKWETEEAARVFLMSVLLADSIEGMYDNL